MAIRKHSSPGVYITDSELSQSDTTADNTILGVAGETLKGPAFETIHVSSWREFKQRFGGTSTELFKGSKYPKYELPYIAKSFLEESQDLEVVKVLGLSGYNAGPAWLLQVYKTYTKADGTTYTSDRKVIGIIRSRGEYQQATFVKSADPANGICSDQYNFDNLVFYARDVKIIESKSLELGNTCYNEFSPKGSNMLSITPGSYGKFTLLVTTNEGVLKYYSISLNTSDKNYITNILGVRPTDPNGAEIYVEEIYQNVLEDLADKNEINSFYCSSLTTFKGGTTDVIDKNGVKAIATLPDLTRCPELAEDMSQATLKQKEDLLVSGTVKTELLAGDLECMPGVQLKPIHSPVDDILTKDESQLSRRDVGKRYLFSYSKSSNKAPNKNNDAILTRPIMVHVSDDKGVTWHQQFGKAGHIYTVVLYIGRDGSRNYYYGEYVKKSDGSLRYTYEDKETNPDIFSNGTSTQGHHVGDFNYDSEYSKKIGFIDNDSVPDYSEVLKCNIEQYTAFGEFTENSAYLTDFLLPKNGINHTEYEAAYADAVNKGSADPYTEANKVIRGTYPLPDYKGQYTPDTFQPSVISVFKDTVKVNSTGLYYVLDHSENAQTASFSLAFNEAFAMKAGKVVIDDVYPLTFDMNDYKEGFRSATTPWIVSELKGSAENIDLTKLFRFTTISDGDYANTEVKVSITDIEPANRTFTVLVRDYYDTDQAPSILERYTKVNLIPGTNNYISKRIGSTDGQYERVSQYITVEVNETQITEASIPAGFMGYPVRCYKGDRLDPYQKTTDVFDPSAQPLNPDITYNTDVYSDIRKNKQYFGLSSLMPYDDDIFAYKGKLSYVDYPDFITPCFHLDSRIFEGKPDSSNNDYVNANGIYQRVSIDGVSGYEWITVGKDNTTILGIEPRIGTEAEMSGTIYEDSDYRKFTLCFYGGFDGWDIYREQRTNTDSFSYNLYKGDLDIKSGYGRNFSKIRNLSLYNLDDYQNAITSDYYAYLAAIRQFSNPKAINIDLLATPGIDYTNNESLVHEVIDMVENDRGETLYILTTADKPSGSGDTQYEMFTPDDVIANLEDTEISSSYVCTYYPHIKYYDEDNNQYIYLPPTRDAVRNFAYTDKEKYPWYASAGMDRGTVDDSATRPRKILTLNEQDTLYDGRINFINTFVSDGMRIWGDKDLLDNEESELNRTSKRRLLNYMKKNIANAVQGLIFDPNDSSTSQSFSSLVTPILQNLVQNKAISAYKLEMDTSQEARDNLELPAKIYFKVLPNLEYITIDLVVTPSGTDLNSL